MTIIYHKNTTPKMLTNDFVKNVIRYFVKKNQSLNTVKDTLIKNINKEFSNKSPDEIRVYFMEKINRSKNSSS